MGHSHAPPLPFWSPLLLCPSQVFDIGVLIAFVTLGLVPLFRVWRSVGYDQSQGFLLTVSYVNLIGVYLLFTAKKLALDVDPSHKWLAW